MWLMGDCPYLDGCLKKKLENVSFDCCYGNHVFMKCYETIGKIEDIVRIWVEEWRRDDMEERVCEFN